MHGEKLEVPEHRMELVPIDVTWSDKVLDRILGFDFFLSYSWSDGAELVGGLHNGLRKRRFRVFIDRQQNRLGEAISQSVVTGIRRSQSLVVLLTPHASANRWVSAEIAAAATLKKTIVLVRIGDAEFVDEKTRSYFTGDRLELRLPSSSIESDRFDADVHRIAASYDGIRRELVARRLMTAIFCSVLVAALVAIWFAIVAENRRAATEREKIIGTAAMLSRRSVELSNSHPVPALLLGARALDVTLAEYRVVLPEAENGIRQQLLSFSGLSVSRRRVDVASAVADRNAKFWFVVDRQGVYFTIGFDGSIRRLGRIPFLAGEPKAVTAGPAGEYFVAFSDGEVFRVPVPGSPRRIVNHPHRVRRGAIEFAGLTTVAWTSGVLATGDIGGIVRVFRDNGETQSEPVEQAQLFAAAVESMTFEDRRIVAAANGRGMGVWSYSGDRSVAAVHGEIDFDILASFSDKQELLLFADIEGRVGVIDPDGRAPPLIVGYHPKIKCLSLNGATGLIATGAADGSVGIFGCRQPLSQSQHGRRNSHEFEVRSVLVDDGFVSSLASDGEVRRISLKPSDDANPFVANVDNASDLIWSRGGAELYCRSARGIHRVWPQSVGPSSRIDSPVSTARTDGRRAAWIDGDRVLVGNIDGSRPVEIGQIDIPLDSIHLHPRKDMVVVVPKHGEPRIFPGAKSLSLGAKPQTPTFSPDGRRLIFGTFDGTVVAFDIRDEKAVGRPDVLYSENVITRRTAIDASSRFLMFGDANGGVFLKDLRNDRPAIKVIDHGAGEHIESDVWSIVSGPKSGQFAVTGQSEQVSIWEIGDDLRQQLVSRRGISKGGSICMEFDPSGDRILVGSLDPEVAQTIAFECGNPTSEPMSFPTFHNSALDVAYSPDGRRVAVLCGIDIVMIWDLAPEGLVKAVERTVGRSLDAEEQRRFTAAPQTRQVTK